MEQATSGVGPRKELEMSAAKIWQLSIDLAGAALVAREKGDDVHAIFFAIKAAETLELAKALGWDGVATHNADDLCHKGERP